MKKFIICCLMAFVCTPLFTACGDDDDDNNNGENIENPDVKIGKASLDESANKLVLTYYMTYMNVSVKEVMTCIFENDICVEATLVETFPNEASAKLSYEAAINEGERATVNGKTVTIDMTEEYAGMKKSEVKLALQALMNMYK